MTRRRAYLVTVPDFVVIADDQRDVRELAAEGARDGHQAQRLSPDELRAYGNVYPVGDWDPDRELSCAEIADEMAKVQP